MQDQWKHSIGNHHERFFSSSQCSVNSWNLPNYFLRRLLNIDIPTPDNSANTNPVTVELLFSSPVFGNVFYLWLNFPVLSKIFDSAVLVSWSYEAFCCSTLVVKKVVEWILLTFWTSLPSRPFLPSTLYV